MASIVPYSIGDGVQAWGPPLVLLALLVRTLIAAEDLSLDGGMEDPAPMGDFEHRGWTMPYWNDELGKYQSELLFASDALLLGRVTYEDFAAARPSRSGDPFTDYINSIPKFVASRTLKEPLTWEARLIEGDVAKEVQNLKQQAGKNILINGSSELVNTLMQHNTLTLSNAAMTSTGVAVLTYQPAT